MPQLALSRADVTRLREMFTARPETSFKAAARMFSVTPKTLKSALYGTGAYTAIADPPPIERQVRHSRLPEPVTDRIIEMRGDGASIRAISRQVQRGYTTVRDVLDRRGIS